MSVISSRSSCCRFHVAVCLAAGSMQPCRVYAVSEPRPNALKSIHGPCRTVYRMMYRRHVNDFHESQFAVGRAVTSPSHEATPKRQRSFKSRVARWRPGAVLKNVHSSADLRRYSSRSQRNKLPNAGFSVKLRNPSRQSGRRFVQRPQQVGQQPQPAGVIADPRHPVEAQVEHRPRRFGGRARRRPTITLTQRRVSPDMAR